MATKPNPDEQPVTRLSDMEVEEVSLVDRAANKRRFLVVKRSKGMAKKKGTAANPQNENDDDDLAGDAGDTGGDDAEDDADTGGDDTDDAGDDASGDTGAASGSAAGGASPEAAGAGTATPVAGEAVDTATLTKAVVDMTEAVQELAQLVDNVSQRVDTVEKAAKKKPAAAAKADDDEDGDDEEDADDEDDAPPPPRKRTRKANPVTQKLTKVRTSLGIKPPAQRADDALVAINKTLEGLRTDLGAIKTGLADQKSRVSRLEKQTGLPSSIPNDGAGKPKNKKVSWPLDLNAPMDRESVGKDVSFHE
jgi:hypothetical protein